MFSEGVGVLCVRTNQEREKNQKGLLSHVAHSPDVPDCLVFWPQAT